MKSPLRATKIRGTKSRNWRFVTYHLCSRMLLPFVAILFTVFRETLFYHPPKHHVSSAAWVSIILSLLFFYFMQVPLLKKDPNRFQRGDLWILGIAWVSLAVLVQIAIAHLWYHIGWSFIVTAYSATYLNPWMIVLIALFIMPRLAAIGTRGWLF